MIETKQELNLIFCISVGKDGLENFKKIYNILSVDKKILIVVFIYDSVHIDFLDFPDVLFFRDKGYKFRFAFRYLNPLAGHFFEIFEKFTKPKYLAFWDDDVSLNPNFNIQDILSIALKNKLGVFQLSLSEKSKDVYTLLFQNKDYVVGRFTNFVEIMCPFYSWDAYRKLFFYISEDTYCGWGLDFVPFDKKGVIDKYSMNHLRSPRSKGKAEMESFLKKYNLEKIQPKVLGSLE